MGCVNWYRKQLFVLYNIFLSFFFLFLFFSFFGFIGFEASFIERKKYIKIDCEANFLYIFFNYPTFLLNEIYISLTLISTAQYSLTFAFIKSSSRTSDKSAWLVYPRNMEQYMWSISL